MIELTNISIVKKILESHGIKTQKHFSQNFLINKGVLDKIIDAANLKPEEDAVVEIGCGLGVLTQELASNAFSVIVYEKDFNMMEIAKKNLSNFTNIEFLNTDILQAKIPSFIYKLVANIPYAITTDILKKFLIEEKNKPRKIVFLIQKEVAEKICAAPPDMNLLAILVQAFGKPKIIQTVSKNSFFPAPKVDSAILKIDINVVPLIPHELSAKFFEIVRATFGKKRKIISQTLAQIFKIEKSEMEKILKTLGINPMSRPENLSIESWLEIVKSRPINVDK